MQDVLQAVENLRPHAQRFAKVGRAQRHHHELLEIDIVIRMLAAVEDVHHRHRQYFRVGASQVAIQRQARRASRRPGNCQRHPQHRVGPDFPLVRRAVEVPQQAIDGCLSKRAHPLQFRCDHLIDVTDGLQHAFAEVALLVAIAQLHGLVRAGAGAARHCRPCAGPIVQLDIHLDGRIPAAVQNLAGVD